VLRQHANLEHWGCIFQLSRFEFPSGGQPSTRDYKDRAAEAIFTVAAAMRRKFAKV